jgi:acyl transferase domain-containing protein
MKKNSYYSNDICIVGMGCVLPDANNPQEFWANILENNCSIRKIPEERWKSQPYFSSDKKEKDKTYSNVAAFVENAQLGKIGKRLGLDPLKNNRLQIMALEATTQALNCINPETLEKTRKNTAIYLGCMEIDEAFTLEKFYLQNKKSLENYIIKNNLKNKEIILKKFKEHFNSSKWDEEAIIASVLTTSTINLIKQKFNIEGEGALIDAACASSLAALDVSVSALKNYKADLVITGGIESYLAPDMFVLFCKVGALSEGKCYPFDEKSSGLSQGEGAVMFVLQRLGDAIKDGNKIYGVIKSSGSSSDGKNSSLFSPSVKGQIIAFERAYATLDKSRVNYIECHGTGTKLGDAIELKALNMFFKDKKIPIGSVKSLIGHLKGAAGSAGVLKCLLSMQDKKIPPSKYLKKFIGTKNGSVYINKKIIDLAKNQYPLRFGISSFGFGNANFHVVLEEFNKNKSRIIKSKKNKTLDPIVVLGCSSLLLKEVDFGLITSKFKIPPQSLSKIDKVQLQALLVTVEAFEKSNMEIDFLDKNEIRVISASCLGLDAALNLSKRVRHFEFLEAFNLFDKASVDLLIKHKDKFSEITEDTGPGVLNNVIAGRICNMFDFKGENFNVDCDFNSFPVALNIAVEKLQEKGSMIVLIYCEEELNKNEAYVERKKINCLILSTLSLAKKNNYPICEIIEKINYHDSK